MTRFFFALAAATLPSACTSLTAPDRPERATVQIEGPASTPMEVVTSMNFLVVEGHVSFVDADTSEIALPLDRTYALGSPGRFYIKASNRSDASERFTTKILIDDEAWVEDERTLEPGQSFEFVYRYLEPSIR